MKKIFNYIKSLFIIPDELKDAFQDLEIKESYLYNGIEYNQRNL